MKALIIRVRRLRNYWFTGKGYVISLDVFFSIILLLGALTYIGLGNQSPSTTPISFSSGMDKKKSLDYAISALDNNGFIGAMLVDDSGKLTREQAQKIYERVMPLMPTGNAVSITITRYEPVDDLGWYDDPNSCRRSKSFANCFKANPATATAGYSGIPSNKEVYRGVQYFMKKEPSRVQKFENYQCILKEELEEKTILPTPKKTKALFAVPITTSVGVTNNALATISPTTPANKLECFDSTDGVVDNEMAIVRISEKSTTGSAISGASITVNAIDGMELCKCTVANCAGQCAAAELSWTSGQISFTGVTIGTSTTSQYYKARLPCAGTYCEKNFVDFPTTGTFDALNLVDKGTFIEIGGDVYEWGDAPCDAATCTGCTLTTCTYSANPLLTRDLELKFSSGRHSTESSNPRLGLSLVNRGGKSFYRDSLSDVGIFVNAVPDDPPGYAASNDWLKLTSVNCSSPLQCSLATLPDRNIHWNNSTGIPIPVGGSADIGGIGIDDAFPQQWPNGDGYIKAVLSGANECQLHNQSTIYCSMSPKVVYFKVEYAMWET
jgi:hypothetical protein